ncbi:MAG TPA: hypothetical protein VGC07_07880 [Granulicella sp.]
MKRLLFPFLLAATLALPLTAQEPAPITRQAPPGDAAPPTPAALRPSSILRGSIDSIHETLDILRPDKWKIPGATAQQAQSNISSIRTDIDGTLPKLLAAADQSPNSVTEVLPALRNVIALYDVLLRVTQTAILSAPTQQIVALNDSLDRLEHAKEDLSDLIQSSATQQNRQLQETQTQLTTLRNAPPPPQPVCAPPPAPKKRPAKKPAAKPAVKPATTTPAPATTP